LSYFWDKFITMRNLLSVFLLIALIAACKKDEPTPVAPPGPPPKADPQLIIKFSFDSTQARLDNLGLPSGIATGNSAQHPKFNELSVHYIELAQSEWTSLGNGAIIYESPMSTAGGDTAIDHNASIRVGEGGIFLSLPLSSIPTDTYIYLRASLSYQNYDIKLRINTPVLLDLTGTVASFIGQNTYIQSYNIKDSSIAVNANKLQGYWGFESIYSVVTGQAPSGATTVPNPIFATSPVPQGSCIVTGAFSPSVLTITGSETSDIVIVLSCSTNNSFEWKDDDMDGFYEPLDGDTVVDMGIRGLIPIIQ